MAVLERSVFSSALPENPHALYTPYRSFKEQHYWETTTGDTETIGSNLGKRKFKWVVDQATRISEVIKKNKELRVG